MRAAVMNIFALLFLLTDAVLAPPDVPSPWDLSALMQRPVYEPAPEFREEGVKAIFFEGLPWRGKPTRVFAWYGFPDGDEKKHPGMVLVHGGEGTAFAEWVRMWNRRGYAAIAMDTTGSVPKTGESREGFSGRRKRHEHAGPDGWDDFENVDLPPEEQWPYHAVADVILAHSLLRSFPQVDAHRIAITGVSYGAFLTLIAASLDARFRIAVPVYGTGFLGEDSWWVPTLEALGQKRRQRWIELWDPARYLPHSKIPFLWVSSPNDPVYFLPSLQKSSRLTKGPRTLVIRFGMKHGHREGAEPQEILAFVDSLLKNKPPLARVTHQELSGGEFRVRFDSPIPVKKAELCYTLDSGSWAERRWQTAPADLDARARRAKAQIPEQTKAFYVNLTDSRGLLVSTEYLEFLLPSSRDLRGELRKYHRTVVGNTRARRSRRPPSVEFNRFATLIADHGAGVPFKFVFSWSGGIFVFLKSRT